MSVSKTLYEARKRNVPVEAKDINVNNLKEAYDIQDEILNLKKDDGETLKGYKISLTSEGTQKLFNSTHPLYGAMTDKQIVKTVSLNDYNDPLLELELVFIVQEELSSEDSVEDIMKKCTVAPGIEVPDGRYKNWFPNISMFHVIADTAVSGSVVIGEDQSFNYEDLKNIDGTIFFNGKSVKTGNSADVLDHPTHAVKWLVEALDARGDKLTKGMFVSSGTFISPLQLEKGEYKAEYKTIGTVKLTVTD